jgi:hypothetical protein
LSRRTLERWRAAGTGPAWVKLNGRIRYRAEDIEAFEQHRLQGQHARGQEAMSEPAFRFNRTR